MKHTLKVGDVLYSSWGYDQTNIDYYQVLKVTASGVYIKRLVDRVTPTPGAFMTGTAVPEPDNSPNRVGPYVFQKDAPLMFKRVNPINNSIHVTKFAGAWKWDGQPKRTSWYA